VNPDLPCQPRSSHCWRHLPVLSWSQVRFNPPILQKPERPAMHASSWFPRSLEAHASERAVLPLQGASRRSTESGVPSLTGRTGVRFLQVAAIPEEDSSQMR